MRGRHILWRRSASRGEMSLVGGVLNYTDSALLCRQCQIDRQSFESKWSKNVPGSDEN